MTLTDFGYLTNAIGGIVKDVHGNRVPVATDPATGKRWSRIAVNTPGFSDAERRKEAARLTSCGAVYCGYYNGFGRYQGWWVPVVPPAPAVAAAALIEDPAAPDA